MPFVIELESDLGYIKGLEKVKILIKENQD